MRSVKAAILVFSLATVQACDETPPPEMQGEVTGNDGIDPTLPQGTSGGDSGTGTPSGGTDGGDPSQGDMSDPGDGQTPQDSDGDGQTPSDDQTPDGDQTSDGGTTTADDTSTSGQDSDTSDDDTSTTSVSCTDQNWALHFACNARVGNELYIEKGTAYPCSTEPIDYCTIEECLEDWAQEHEDARAPCRVKYPLCYQIWQKATDILMDTNTCASDCLGAYTSCQNDHYCDVGGPDNADPMVTQACSQAYSDCLAACAPLPPSMPIPSFMPLPR